ncbi:MAG TPA: 4Fe-4S dicluster domain-containing protein [Candidatus Limnocylindrales bacterium]
MTEPLNDGATPATAEPNPMTTPDPTPAQAADPTPVTAEPTPRTTTDPGTATTEPTPAAQTGTSTAEPTPAAETGPALAETPDRAYLVPLDELAPAITAASTSRRAFLGFGLAVAGGLVGAAVISRFIPIFEDASDAASPIAGTYDPASKQWTFVVDTAACIGCGLCVAACKEENNVPEEEGFTRTWVERHTVTTDGVLYVDSPNAGIDGFPAESTAPGAAGKPVQASHFEPRLCMQCVDSPCTAVCPVGATYHTEDGVILIDSRRCIGCGYCVVACPYGARYIVPAGGNAPNDTPGVADKCTWCYHRISQGQLPACVEICPVGARKFGDAADENSEIARIVREQKPQQLNPEYGTNPRVLYLGPSVEEA